MTPEWLLEKLAGAEGHLKDQPPLMKREFKDLSTDPIKDGTSFRVMQWNQLASALASTQDNFIKCPKEVLNWKVRRYRVLEELLTYKADIICLQEVDHYTDFILPSLTSVGFQCAFVPKPNSPCLHLKGSVGPDGCVVAVRTSKFALLKTDTVVLKSEQGKPSNQVALVARVRYEAAGPWAGTELCVVCAHLKAKPEFEQTRLAQARHLLEELTARVGLNVPLLLAGDFNAEPTEEAYKTVASSPLRLGSIYTQLSGGAKSEPPYTTWKVRPTGEEKRCIDYVWASQDSLRAARLLQLPTEQQVGDTRCPSASYPSDHFSLVADIVFK